MAVNVSWGCELPRYDKSNEEYNSPIFRWDRYSENMKRGYVLKHRQNIWLKRIEGGKITNMDEKPENPILMMGFIRGLRKIEEVRCIGFDILTKAKRSRKSKKEIENQLNSLLSEMPEIFNEEYHRWGIEGDEYSPSNNPFSNNN